MIDGMFQAGTDSALDDQVQRPAPLKPEEPGFSVNQALIRPVGAAAAGRIAFAAELAGAFGDVMGAGGFNAGGMFAAPTPEERKQQNEASTKLLQSGPQFSNEAGDTFRARAKELMPDPLSTSTATQVVGGLVEGLTTAVGYGLTVGPAAPFLFGADTGMAEADKLKQQGVDQATRTTVGLVTGAANAASIALPVVGKTVAKTAGLVVAGGPGTFITQNAATRAILEANDYGKQGSQYDPLDPVGLALSSVVPAVFGGVALRARAKAPVSLKDVVLGIESNGQRFGKDGKVLTSPKGAKGEMQVMDGTNLDPGFGVRPAVDDSLAERARVGSDYLDAMLKRYGSEDKAMAAYNAGPGAVDKALAKGGDWLKSLPAETQAYVTKGMKKLEGGRTTEAARAVIARDPEAVAAARVSQTAQVVDSFRLTPDSDLAGMTRHTDAMESAHDMLARGERVEVSDIVRAAPERIPGQLAALADGPHYRVADLSTYTSRLYRDTSIDAATRFFPGNESQSADLHFANDPAYALGQGTNSGVRMEFDAAGMPGQLNMAKPGARQSYESGYAEFINRDAFPADLTGNLRSVTVQPAAQQGPYFKRLQSSLKSEGFDIGVKDQNGALIFTRPVADRPAALAAGLRKAFEPLPEPRAPRAPAAEKLQEATARPAPAAPKEGAGTPEAKQSAALESQSAEIAAIDPDMMVQVEGREPMKVSDLLDQVKAEAKEDAQEASLVDVAANCFVRT